jgi:hypothetical protein
MEIRRTKMPKKNPIRVELEHVVIAWNTCLREVVSKMDIIILLRNATPNLRSDYAYKLKDAGLIHPDEVTEFIKRTEPRRGIYG